MTDEQAAGIHDFMAIVSDDLDAAGKLRAAAECVRAYLGPQHSDTVVALNAEADELEDHSRRAIETVQIAGIALEAWHQNPDDSEDLRMVTVVTAVIAAYNELRKPKEGRLRHEAGGENSPAES